MALSSVLQEKQVSVRGAVGQWGLPHVGSCVQHALEKGKWFGLGRPRVQQEQSRRLGWRMQGRASIKIQEILMLRT